MWGERTRFDPKGARLMRQGLMEHAPHALAHIQRELLAASPSPATLAPQLRALSVPTCLIAGSDAPESLGPCQELAQLLPRAELHVLEGAGHVVNMTTPTLFNQIMQQFLAPFQAACPFIGASDKKALNSFFVRCDFIGALKSSKKMSSSQGHSNASSNAVAR